MSDRDQPGGGATGDAPVSAVPSSPAKTRPSDEREDARCHSARGDVQNGRRRQSRTAPVTQPARESRRPAAALVQATCDAPVSHFRRCGPSSPVRVRLGSTARRWRYREGDRHGTHRRERRSAQVLLLRQEPEAGAAADRRTRRVHLRRVRRAVQRDHRGAPGRGRRRDLERFRPPQAERDLLLPRGVRHRPGARQARPLRRRLQPLQAHPGPLDDPVGRRA